MCLNKDRPLVYNTDQINKELSANRISELEYNVPPLYVKHSNTK